MPEISNEEYHDYLTRKVVSNSLKIYQSWIVGIYAVIALALALFSYFGFNLNKKAEMAFASADSVRIKTKKAEEDFQKTQDEATTRIGQIDSNIKHQKEMMLALSSLPQNYNTMAFKLLEDFHNKQNSAEKNQEKSERSLKDIAKAANDTLKKIDKLSKDYQTKIDHNDYIIKGYTAKFQEQLDVKSKVLDEIVNKGLYQIDEQINVEELGFSENATRFSQVCDCYLKATDYDFRAKKRSLEITAIRKNASLVKTDIIVNVPLKEGEIKQINVEDKTITIVLTSLATIYSTDGGQFATILVKREPKKTAPK